MKSESDRDFSFQHQRSSHETPELDYYNPKGSPKHFVDRNSNPRYRMRS
jgi:hypothetical protein